MLLANEFSRRCGQFAVLPLFIEILSTQIKDVMNSRPWSALVLFISWARAFLFTYLLDSNKSNQLYLFFVIDVTFPVQQKTKSYFQIEDFTVRNNWAEFITLAISMNYCLTSWKRTKRSAAFLPPPQQQN